MLTQGAYISQPHTGHSVCPEDNIAVTLVRSLWWWQIGLRIFRYLEFSQGRTRRFHILLGQHPVGRLMLEPSMITRTPFR